MLLKGMIPIKPSSTGFTEPSACKEAITVHTTHTFSQRSPSQLGSGACWMDPIAMAASFVFFTDESWFSLDNNDGLVRVWRRKGGKLVHSYIAENDRYGRGSIKVRGCIAYGNPTRLYVVPRRALIELRYMDEIIDSIVKSYEKMQGKFSISWMIMPVPIE